MSGFLYNGYCYSTLQEIANVVDSLQYSGAGTLLYDLNTKVIGTSSITFYQVSHPVNSTQTLWTNNGEMTFNYPICPTVGPYVPSTISQLFDTYFQFDPVFFEQIQAEMLIAFALGLSVGAVVKLLHKT